MLTCGMPEPFDDHPLSRWFDRVFAAPTPVQRAAWPTVVRGEDTLIVSATGTGKTLAAFFAILHRLGTEHAAGCLAPGIQALYVSPLRALGYDLQKNLLRPLTEVYGAHAPLRVGLRNGDTSAAERQRQSRQPPHVLLTTPESLSLLLSQTRWLAALARVRWVVVDEIHALAGNKRGAHLSLSLERLDDLRRRPARYGLPAAEPEGTPRPRAQRIGLSATVAPLDLVGSYLVGTARSCCRVDAATAKRTELRVHTPLRRDPYPPAGFSGVRLMRELGRLVRRHQTTLVFTNTRSGAESATFWLREALPDLAAQIECHHASLHREVRLEVEDRLKRGELRAVVCSTSLELGIDIGAVDLVVMLATPKGVTRALQRAGRSGHDVRRLSRGVLMATNINDLVECCATALLARQRHLDDVRIPEAPLDVLAQHLVGMGCLRRWTLDEALALVRGAWSYRGLDAATFREVLDYLAGGGRSLREQYTELFGRIGLDDAGFETRTQPVRRDFYQNVGTIPSEGLTVVRLRGRMLGTVEESFARQLQAGDVFLLSGRPVEVDHGSPAEVWVRAADHRTPTVPRWNANKMPLANNVAAEIVAFRSELRARLAAGEENAHLVDWVAQRLDCGLVNARIIFAMYAAQHRVSEIPTRALLLIEAYHGRPPLPDGLALTPAPRAETRPRRPRPRAPDQEAAWSHYFFHTLIGRAANDALSRVVAWRLRRRAWGNAVVTPDDYGFVLTFPVGNALEADTVTNLLEPAGFETDLAASLERSELLKYHFRNAAQTGLMVYRNCQGEARPHRKLQFSSEVIFQVLSQHEPDHVLLREARRDAVHTFLDQASAVAYLHEARAQPVRLRQVAQVPPLCFAMYATRIREVMLLEDPTETLERLYQHWWKLVGGTANGAESEGAPNRTGQRQAGV